MVTEGKVTEGKMFRCIISIAGAIFFIYMDNYVLKREAMCLFSVVNVLGRKKFKIQTKNFSLNLKLFRNHVHVPSSTLIFVRK